MILYLLHIPNVYNLLINLFFSLQLMKLANDNQFVDNFILPFKLKIKFKLPFWCNYFVLTSCFYISGYSSAAVLAFWMASPSRQNSKLRNSISKSLLFSTMLQSWMWFMCLYGYQLRGLSLFKDFLLSRRAVISTAYMPCLHIWYSLLLYWSQVLK